MSRLAQLFADVYPHISSDIFKFCQFMNFHPTWQQEELLGCVQRGDTQIATRSGQGPGKTTCAAIVAGFRTIKANKAQTIVTAPTMRQCRDVFLAEFRRLLENADPLARAIFSATATTVSVLGDREWGIKTVTATAEENAQGYHDPNQTIICEEASGIPRGIIEQFKGTASNPNSLLLLIGNPNTRDCAFFDCFYGNTSRYWVKLHWNAEETPNSAFFNLERNYRVAAEYGKDSDVYRIRVLGEFPHTDPNSVMSMEDLERVCDRNMILAASKWQYEKRIPKQFGIDFSRFGGDESTLFRRHGNAIVQHRYFNHTEPADVVDLAFEWQRKASWRDEDCWYIPDASGMGQGVLSQFYRAKKQVVEFHNGGSPVDSQFENKVTEAYFNLRNKIRSGQPIFIPNDPILHRQLTNRIYFVNKKGKIVLESKDDYKDRGHDSPDRADGLVQAMYDRIMARSQFASASRSTQVSRQPARY